MGVHRTLLYVPADRIDSLWARATASGTDAVIVDLEDGVAPGAKSAARSAAAGRLSSADSGPDVVVRINSGVHLADDLRMLADFPDVPVMLPKSDADTLAEFDALDTGTRSVIALVESATGLVALSELARHPRVSRLALGEADLRADLGIDERAEESLWALRTLVVVASRAADLPPPVAPVSTDWKNIDALAESCARLRDAGFGARTAIHPDQVAVIRGAFVPTPAEIDAARRIVEIHEQSLADGRGVSVGDDGRMIDEAVVRSARRLLS